MVQRSTILTLSALGLDAKQVAVMTSCDVRTVKHWLEQYKTTGSIEDAPGRGRKRITTDTQDDKIVRSCLDYHLQLYAHRLQNVRIRQQLTTSFLIEAFF